MKSTPSPTLDKVADFVSTRIEYLSYFIDQKTQKNQKTIGEFKASLRHGYIAECCEKNLRSFFIDADSPKRQLKRAIRFNKKLLCAVKGGRSSVCEHVSIVTPSHLKCKDKRATSRFVLNNKKMKKTMKITYYDVIQRLTDIPVVDNLKRRFRAQPPVELSAENPEQEIEFVVDSQEQLPIFFIWICNGGRCYTNLVPIQTTFNETNERIYQLLKPTSDYKKLARSLPSEEEWKDIEPAPKLTHRDSDKDEEGMDQQAFVHLSRMIATRNDKLLFQIQSNMPAITPSNYHETFRTCLHLEYLQNVEDMKMYNLTNHDITAIPISNNSVFRQRQYRIQVEGLVEKRPCVIRGDQVLVAHRKLKKRFWGRVEDVERDSVIVTFHETFIDLQRGFSVSFVASDTTLRRALTSVESSHDQSWISTVLFPTIHQASIKQDDVPVALKQHVLKLNDKQESAVTSILSLPKNMDFVHPYVIFGPPGTGKTHVITETILRLLMHTDKKILIACPSNSSADLIAQRILDQMKVLDSNRTGFLIRLNAQNRTASPSLAHVSKHDVIDRELKMQIVVTTCSTCWQLNYKQMKFDYLFLDEVGQATEPESLISICNVLKNYSRTHIILSGDPKQLGPVLHYKPAVQPQKQAFPLSISLLERLCELPLYKRNTCFEQSGCYNPLAITKLVENYRSHELILKKPSEMFYDNDLIATRGNESSFLEWPMLPELARGIVPIAFFHVDGIMYQEGNSPSWFNIMECVKIEELLLSVRQHRPKASIGIITPYFKQKKKLELLLTGAHANPLLKSDPIDMKIGSVEDFQGQERDVIIISTARSRRRWAGNNHIIANCDSIGFLKSPRRLNVAMTRAKDLLIFVGNSDLLRVDDEWAQVIDFCKEKHVLIR